MKDAENGVKGAKLFIGDVAFIDEAYYRCTVEQATSDGKKTTKASYYLNGIIMKMIFHKIFTPHIYLQKSCFINPLFDSAVTRVENVYSVEGDKIEIKCKHHNYSIGTVVNWSHGKFKNIFSFDFGLNANLIER